MEAIVRTPFQGVTNIVRFNWHFYVFAVVSIAALLVVSSLFLNDAAWLINSVAILIFGSTAVSLAVSYYVYDYSSLYNFDWLDTLNIQRDSKIVNINAGFDETSFLLSSKYPHAALQVFDFYDAEKHTEISIERARKAYAPFPGVKQITTGKLPLEKDSIDFIFNIFSAHEIRNREERILFLTQLKHSLRDNGRCVIVEHLRDVPNFFAYNIGFLHFFSPSEWRSNICASGMVVEREIKITPFISVFILKKNDGTTS
jgi:hypothetical protein